MAIERLPIPVGTGFDPENPDHLAAVQGRILEVGHGTGWEVQSYDPETGVLTMSRRSALTKVSREDRGNSYRVELRRGIKPSDGEKIAAELESDPTHAGHYMTSFDPYLAQATLTKLTGDELRARGAVATALGVKPWDVQAKAMRGGGFHIGLPKSYVPSKHDKKLEEVASEIVGKPGWFWRVDATAMKGELVPGELPTFPPAYMFDFSTLPEKNLTVDDDLWDIPIGVALGGRGKDNAPFAVDFKDSVGALLVGLAGSGKAQPLDTEVPVPASRKFPRGWASIGTLEHGDLVYVADGSTAPVSSVSEVREEDEYVVHLSDGTSHRVAGGHLWTVTDLHRKDTRPSPDRYWAGVARSMLYSFGNGMSATIEDIYGLLVQSAGEGAPNLAPGLDHLPLENLAQPGGLYPVAEVLALYAAEYDPRDEVKPPLRVVRTVEMLEDPGRFTIPLGGYSSAPRRESAPRLFLPLEDVWEHLRDSLADRVAVAAGVLSEHAVERSEGVFAIGLDDPDVGGAVVELMRSVGYYADHLDPVQVIVRRGRHAWASVTRVERTGERVPMRCLRVNHPEHLYMTGDFVPTHNSVTTQGIIFNALARGWRLALINTKDKATDFMWAKPFVAPHMWGCDSVAQSVAVAKLVAEEGERLGELLSKHGASKWQDLPAEERLKNPPLLLVADELAALLTADRLPAGLSREQKALPEFVQMQQDLLEASLLGTSLAKIPAVYRAAGIRTIYLTQQPNEKYGFSTKLKGNLPHRIMLGTSPSQAEKGHAFRTPEKVPDVPPNIAVDAKAARGVGLAHLDGSEPIVFKGFFAPLEKYLEAAAKMAFPTTSIPEPTEEQIARLVPRVDADVDAEDVFDEDTGGGAPSGGEAGFGRGPRKYEAWELDADGKPLSPAQRANAARAKLAADAREMARDD